MKILTGRLLARPAPAGAVLAVAAALAAAAVLPSAGRVPAALGAAGLAGTPAGGTGHGGGTTGPVTGLTRAPLSPVRWGTCQHGIARPFQCATVPVPLDYRHPAGRRISLALLRLPASDPAKRIGSLFTDFGGPGGPDITDLVNRAFTAFGAAVRRRFDLVTWDPRGIEYSTAVNCFASRADASAYFNSIPVFPYPQSGEPSYFARNAQLGTGCQRRSGFLLPHISSADTARDLNLIRRDLGEKKLNYLGFSYGTVIGATYANLFPRHVRAMVLDGTLDFAGNATGHPRSVGHALPVDVRQGVDRAGQDAFNRFLSLCARAGGRCAFSGGNLHAKWATLLARAQAGQLSYQNLMTLAYFDMENPIADWPALASDLRGLFAATKAGRAVTSRQAAGLAAAAAIARTHVLGAPVAGHAAPAAGPPAAGTAYSVNRVEAFYAIQCADSVAPTRISTYHDLAISEDKKVPGFGRLITHDMMPCASWPAMHTDPYDGPWDGPRSTILIINAEHDPITPIWGAKAAAGELHDARLLTVNGDGHTSMFGEPSSCRQAAEDGYLTALKLPPPGTVCPVDRLPWGLAP